MGANGQPYSVDLGLMSPIALSTSWQQVRMISAQSHDAAIIGSIESLRLLITTIAGGAANVVVRLTMDPNGDQPLSADVSTAISVGLTTATSGAALVAFPSLVYPGNPITPNIYIWAKTDAGTCNVTSGAMLGWAS